MAPCPPAWTQSVVARSDGPCGVGSRRRLPRCDAVLASFRESQPPAKPGRLDASHVLVADDGRPRLCGLAGAEGAAASDDVAALGALLGELLDVESVHARVSSLRREPGGFVSGPRFAEVVAGGEPVPAQTALGPARQAVVARPPQRPTGLLGNLPRPPDPVALPDDPVLAPAASAAPPAPSPPTPPGTRPPPRSRGSTPAVAPTSGGWWTAR